VSGVFDTDYDWDELLEAADREAEAHEAALHVPTDDDRGRRCLVCGDPVGIRCCPYGADRP
jgi:hypothetical protein